MSAPPNHGLYELIGEREGVHALVERFYAVMDSLPAAADVRAMHPEDLTQSKHHLELFLTMWSGGPQDYMAERGHPRMRRRHMPFAIDGAARDAWLVCMGIAAHELVPDEAVRDRLLLALAGVAEQLRNRD